MAQGDVKFIMVRGRVIPIHKGKKIELNKDRKKIKSAIIKSATAATIAGVGVKFGLKDLRKSFFSFNKASDFAAMRKLVKRGSSQRQRLITQSAAFRVTGRKFSKRSSFKLKAALGIGSLLLGSAATDLLSTNKNTKEAASDVGNIFSTALTIGALAIVGSKFKIRSTTHKELFTGLQRKGAHLASKKIREVADTGLGKKERSRLSKLLSGRIFQMKNRPRN